MRWENDLSMEKLKKIHLCDSSYLNNGINMLLKNFETAVDLDDINDSILFAPLQVENEKPIHLFHYTGANALTSIISGIGEFDENNDIFTLRFSRVDYMNDIYDGGEIFNFIFQEYIASKLNNANDSFISYVKQMVEQRHSGTYSNTKRVSYICSLTVDGDSLPMWRNYTSSNGGYNIEFDAKTLAEYRSDGYMQDLILIPVIYDCEIMLKIVESMLNKLSEFWNEENKDCFEDLLHNFIFFSKLSFKHPSFSHEQEIRLLRSGKRIYDVNPFENYSEMNGILRPYINVEIPTVAIQGITVGPLLEAEVAGQMVKDMIGRYMPLENHINIKMSVAPIRF